MPLMVFGALAVVVSFNQQLSAREAVPNPLIQVFQTVPNPLKKHQKTA
jgi:hypothetical protein